jgi:K(+)-stimulated pyrophosphate-energized sodium pump
MIKVVNLVSVIIAPIVVTFTVLNFWIIGSGVILLALLAWAIWKSKKNPTTEAEVLAVGSK